MLVDDTPRLVIVLVIGPACLWLIKNLVSCFTTLVRVPSLFQELEEQKTDLSQKLAGVSARAVEVHTA